MLGALLTIGQNKGKVINIPVDRIFPSPYQPRKAFEPDALADLCESIRRHGVIQPIAVRKRNGDFELIAGERRLRASKMAGLQSIPAVIMDMEDDDAAALSLVENIQREDLSYMEEAEAYFWLLQKNNLTQEELALKIGKRQSTIANKLRLLKLSPPLKKLIAEHGLTERHARALLKLHSELAQIKAVNLIIERGLNVQAAEKMIDRMLEEKPQLIKSRTQLKVMKDVRIFVNTLKQAVDMMKEAGITANAEETEFDSYIQYIITINK